MLSAPPSLQQADLVKVDLLLNSSPVDALAFIAHKESAQRMARQLVARLKGTIDRREGHTEEEGGRGSSYVLEAH